MKKIKVGLIVGGGTGQELAEVFCRIIKEVSSLFTLKVEIRKNNFIAKTYWELRKLSWKKIEKEEKSDLRKLWGYLLNVYKDGVRVVFRTAINAETLYQLRRKGLAVKIFPVELKDGRKILLIRDEMQGFYTNDRYELSNEFIKFKGSFHKDYIQKIITYVLQERQKYMSENFKIWAIYKYHLFANVIEKWFYKIAPEIKIYQPDTGIDLLIKYIKEPLREPHNLILVTGNEIGDTLCEFLMFVSGIGNKNTMFSWDVFLCKELYGLTMYQTIHGSADDIKGKNIVNPIATIKATGHLIENFLGIKGLYSVFIKILNKAKNNGILTQDLGGTIKTTEVVDFLLKELKHLLTLKTTKNSSIGKVIVNKALIE